MKEIKNSKWKIIKIQDGKETEGEECLADLLTTLINFSSQQKQEKGINHFRTIMRIGKAFDLAEDNIIKLNDYDYGYIIELVKKEIPAGWARNKGLAEAIEEFLKGDD